MKTPLRGLVAKTIMLIGQHIMCPGTQFKRIQLHQIVDRSQIDIRPTPGPLLLQLVIALAVNPKLYGGSMTMGNPLAVAIMLLEAMTVVIAGSGYGLGA